MELCAASLAASASPAGMLVTPAGAALVLAVDTLLRLPAAGLALALVPRAAHRFKVDPLLGAVLVDASGRLRLVPLVACFELLPLAAFESTARNVLPSRRVTVDFAAVPLCF